MELMEIAATCLKAFSGPANLFEGFLPKLHIPVYFGLCVRDQCAKAFPRGWIQLLESGPGLGDLPGQFIDLPADGSKFLRVVVGEGLPLELEQRGEFCVQFEHGGSIRIGNRGTALAERQAIANRARRGAVLDWCAFGLLRLGSFPT